MEQIVSGLVIGVVVLAGIAVVTAILKRFLYVCEPNEVIVFTGVARVIEGRKIGYTVLRSGRRVRIPVLEQAKRIDVSTMTVDVHVANAYSKGNIPLNVHAIANVKIARDAQGLENAIERFLDLGRDEIRRVAKETIEGSLRGVLAKLTPEQVNEDRHSFVHVLSEEAEDDLRKIGLHIDTLKIQSMTDQVNYLDSIGRARIAEVLRDAEVAESNYKREADQVIAEFESRARVAQENAGATVQQARNELRRMMAEFEAMVRTAEEKTQGAETEARARAEVALQDVRTELERLRLQADEVLPAEARRQAAELLAQGANASIAEQGRAAAEVIALVSDAWSTAGTHADEIAVLQQIDGLLARVVERLKSVTVERINVVDGGSGESLGRVVAAYPGMVNAMFQVVGDTVGIDIREILRRPSGGASGTGGGAGPRPGPVAPAARPSAPTPVASPSAYVAPRPAPVTSTPRPFQVPTGIPTGNAGDGNTNS